LPGEKAVQFHYVANFREANFDSLAEFYNAQFHNLAYFWEAQFHSLANFEMAKFHSWATFVVVKFDSLADFRGTKFDSLAEFYDAQFDNLADFERAQFHSWANFRGVKFDSLAVADFRSAVILDSVIVGNAGNIQRFDFSLAKLIPGAKIIIYDPVEIKIQHEKFHFISLPKKLDYFSKKVTVDGTKRESYKGNDYAKERFELDYIFAKSTIYEDKSTRYLENRWYQVWKYPKWFLNTLYYLTMGLGYRPFRLAWWVLGLIIGFGIFYFFKMRDSINGYILKKFEMKESSGTKRKKDVDEVRKISRTESLINCFYFSSMLLFTFRLKGEILTFFGLKEKRIIVGEYLLGLLIYISFLTLAKSGSILHNLKSLFIG